MAPKKKTKSKAKNKKQPAMSVGPSYNKSVGKAQLVLDRPTKKSPYVVVSGQSIKQIKQAIKKLKQSRSPLNTFFTHGMGGVTLEDALKKQKKARAAKKKRGK